MIHKPLVFRRMVGVLAILLPLLSAALACNMQVQQDDTLRQTDIALGIQQTQLAQTAAALVGEGSRPTQPPAPASPTPVAPTPTPGASIVDQPTTAVPPTPEAPQPSATAAAPTSAPVSTEEIKVTDWRLNYFAALGSGCKVADAGCWRMLDDFKKHFGGELSLVSRKPVLIDSSWPRPYLVFWHKYKFENKARIDVSADGKWSTMLVLDKQKSSNNWKETAIDLSQFKGKEVLLNFAAYGIWGSGGIPGSDWMINDVRIVPNYTP